MDSCRLSLVFLFLLLLEAAMFIFPFARVQGMKRIKPWTGRFLMLVLILGQLFNHRNQHERIRKESNREHQSSGLLFLLAGAQIPFYCSFILSRDKGKTGRNLPGPIGEHEEERSLTIGPVCRSEAKDNKINSQGNLLIKNLFYERQKESFLESP